MQRQVSSGIMSSLSRFSQYLTQLIVAVVCLTFAAESVAGSIKSKSDKNSTDTAKSNPGYSSNGAKSEVNSTQTFSSQPQQELPIALIIASPVVAGFIIIFVCLSYCWHSHQLDARARITAMNAKAQELSRVVVQPVPPPRISNPESDIHDPDAKSMMQPLHSGHQPKRASIDSFESPDTQPYDEDYASGKSNVRTSTFIF